MSDALTNALALHQAGQWAPAARLYQQVLASRPDDANALHLLGVLYHQQGRHEDAVELIGRAIALRPDNAAFHANLAEACRALGRLEQAAQCCRTALRLQPNYPEALNNLGLALHGLQRYAEAVESFEAALRLRPDFPQAHLNLGLSLLELGRSDEALVHCRRAVDLAPGFAPAHAGIGRVLTQQGRLRDAGPWLKQAAELDPQNADSWTALAETFRKLGMPAEAIPCWERVVSLAPQRLEARLFLGEALREEGRTDEGMEHFRAVLRERPDAAPPHVFLGELQEVLGELEEAEASYRAALRIDPTCVPAHVNLAKLLRGRLPEADRAALEERLADPEGDLLVRTHLLFGLTGVLDDRGEYSRAAETSRKANALQEEWARGCRQDHALQDQFLEDLPRFFGTSFFARVAGWGLDTRCPVFVFGLPRSGTTLVEQVLASHPKVHGAGELQLANDTFAAIPGALGRSGSSLSCVPHLTDEALRRLAGQHLERLRKRDVRAARVVDKLPENYLHLGLLAALFPQATFIHCRRDLRDVALSCWLTHFATIPWANTVERIGTRFGHYLRLMAHWRKVLPVPMHEVVYEEMVSDLEGNARRLIAACGLEWDPACLEFHRSKRPVRTASATQVRQPIYTRSVGRWKHYEAHLPDLFAALPREQEQPADPDPGCGTVSRPCHPPGPQVSGKDGGGDLRSAPLARSGDRATTEPSAEAPPPADPASLLPPSPPSLSDLLASAFRLHQAEQWASAAQLYQQVLASRPDDADALHLLGVLHYQQGRHAQAAELIGRAVELRPGAPDMHANLGEVYRSLGQYERAAACCRAALRLKPQYPEALNNLGLALHGLRRFDQATVYFRRALQVKPDFATAHDNLGQTLRELRRFDEALACLRRAVELAPANAMARGHLGRLLLERGQPAEALPHCREAVRLRPDLGALHHNLGLALVALGHLEEAGAAYREAVRLAPGLAAAHADLGFLLRLQSRLRDALPYLKRAVELEETNLVFRIALAEAYRDLGESANAVPAWEHVLALDPRRADAHMHLGWALQLEMRTSEALEHYRTAMRLQPDLVGVRVLLGDLYEELGELAQAESVYREEIRLHPDYGPAHTCLAKLLRGKLPDADRAALEQVLAQPSLHPEIRSNLLYGLTQVLDARGEYARAAATSREGNALALQCARGRSEYNPPEHEMFVDNLVRVFDRDFFGRVAGWGLDTRRPVFVFGLPRSGTTLVEQVLASHPRVFGAGELRFGSETFFFRLPAATGRGELLECVPRIDAAAVRRMGEEHLERLRALDGGKAERVVDKQPDNYLYLGLLAALFPHAAFIHCRRDLRDVALSCWTTSFIGAQWTNDVGHIASRFRQYLRLMAHWRQVLPAPIHDVNYEDMVSDLEGNARRLIAACGLEWDPACLEFHRTRRPIRTASVTQVRQPIYKKSVARWKNYEPHLADLFAALPREEQPGKDPSLALQACEDGGNAPRPEAPAKDVPSRTDAKGADAPSGVLEDALALHRAGQLADAERLYQSFLARQPDDPDALHLLGVLHHQQGRHARAVELIGRAIALRPGAPVFHSNLAEVLRVLGEHERAAEACRTALRLKPDYPGALNNLGLALRGLGRHAEAIEHFRRALALDPECADVHNNLGDSLRREGQTAEAEAALQEALRLQPDYAEAHNNLALLRLRQGRLDEALAGFTEAVRIKPDYADTRCNRGMAWLLLGDFARGWPEYEWRRRTKGVAPRTFPQPDWDGSPLQGRKIFLYAEQGLGDAIQFVRYAPLVKEKGGVVLVEAPPRLLPLLKSCPGIDSLVPAGGLLPPFDTQSPLLSLPGLLGTTLATIPAAVPYLSPDPDLVRRWREELKRVPGFRVGIAWQGSPTYGDDQLRSIPLRRFAPLARLPGVRLVSLQKGPGTEQLTAVGREWGIHDLGPGLDQERGAFMDTAAIMACLDLVVISDSAIAHLAGALAVPTWVALPDACDWRWLLERTDSPWYPTLRLFRQRRGGSWDEVFARIAEELSHRQRGTHGGA